MMSTGVPTFLASATPLSSGPASISGTPSSCMEWRSSSRSARSTKAFTTCARLVSTVVAGWSSRPQVRLKSSSTRRDLNGVLASKL